MHGYSYADNVPTSLTDPSGLQADGPQTEVSNYPYDILENTLRQIKDFLPQDPDCLRFLCSNHGNTLDTIDQILTNHLLGVGWILPTTNRDGSLTLTNAQTPGVSSGQMIAMNLLGSLFNTLYQGQPFPDEGGFRPASAGARGFLMLHELAHVMSDTTGSHIFENDAGNHDAVVRNNNLLLRNCKKLIGLLGGGKR